MLDDDVTSSALRLLIRVDHALDYKNQQIHNAAKYGLSSVMKAQYPNGSWSHNYDRFPLIAPSSKYYPVKKASYPKEWSRKWTKDFAGCYVINDRITPDQVKTFLVAHDIYKDKKYLEVAKKGGDFFILAQMPDPQPAWAQQYNRDMHPVWDRSFEPPAITGGESQDVLDTLLLLYRKTGDGKYLRPVSKALPYLEKSKLSDGRLARFYELKSNRPVYFTKRYQITYDSANSPTHYSFTVDSRLPNIRKEYMRLMVINSADPKDLRPTRKDKLSKALISEVRKIIKNQDNRGAWVEKGGFVRNLEGRKVPGPLIQSSTFVKNVDTLCRFLRALPKK